MKRWWNFFGRKKLAEKLYLNHFYDAEISTEDQLAGLEWRLIEETGWSIEYVRSLSLTDIGNFLAVQDAKFKIQQSESKKKKH